MLGVALAVSVSVSAAEGPWEPIETVVGLVLMLVVRTYFRRDGLARDEDRGRRLALAGVVGLCWCLIAAWPIQSVLFAKPDLTVFALPVVWLVATVVEVRRLRYGRLPRARRYPQWLVRAYRKI